MHTSVEISTTSLPSNKLNLFFFYLGDPITTRTAIYGTNTDYEDAQAQTALVRSYLKSIEDVAGGFSALLKKKESDYVKTSLSFGGVADFLSFFEASNGPLVGLDDEIPLNCSSSVPMAKFNQTSEGIPPFDVVVQNEAWIPNCTFSGLRTSGIHPGPTGSVEILEHAHFLAIYAERNRGSDILLRNGADFFQSLQLSPDSKRLARDRQDWTKGRVVSEVDGVRIGNLTIDFGRVVLASGPEKGWYEEEERRHFHALVAEIKDTCPPRPSGFSSKDTSCVAVMTLYCDSFPGKLGTLVVSNSMRSH